MKVRPEQTLATLEAAVGTQIALTPWAPVTAQAVASFARVVERWPDDVIPPEMLLSLLGGLVVHIPRIVGTTFGMNYGIDDFRAARPIQSGVVLRARFVLAGLEVRGPSRTLMTLQFTFETTEDVVATGRWLILSVT